jgi:hypothetical protein
MVVHTYNASYSGWWFIPIMPVTPEKEAGGSQVQGQTEQKVVRLYFKTGSRRPGGTAEMVEHCTAWARRWVHSPVVSKTKQTSKQIQTFSV